MKQKKIIIPALIVVLGLSGVLSASTVMASIVTPNEAVEKGVNSTERTQDGDISVEIAADGKETCYKNDKEINCDKLDKEAIESSENETSTTIEGTQESQIKVETSDNGKQTCYENDKEVSCDELNMTTTETGDGTVIDVTNPSSEKEENGLSTTDGGYQEEVMSVQTTDAGKETCYKSDKEVSCDGINVVTT